METKSLEKLNYQFEKIDRQLSDLKIKLEAKKNNAFSSDKENIIKNIEFEIAQCEQIKTKVQEQINQKRNITVSIDFSETNEVDINIHTIVGGKIREQYNVPFNNNHKSFTLFWKDIGDEIENHMRENPEYYPFGS